MGFRRKVILLVEDDVQQAQAILKKIEAIGKYKAIWAKDGFEGLKQIRNQSRFMGFSGNRISCILLDMRMPNMDGTEFIKKLRKREKWRMFERYCPVIFLTAYQEEEYYRTAMNEYACDYLNKPVEQEELAAVLKLIIEDYDYFSAVESKRKLMRQKIKELKVANNVKEQVVAE